MPATSVAHELDRFSKALERKLSVVDQVRLFLRELILSGKLKAGERLVETRFARQLGIGQPTVREALARLQDEGLIVRQPNRGCTVVELSPQEVSQIFRLRIAWEALAVELAMENWTPEKARELSRALKKLQIAACAGDAQKYYRADLEFHQALWRLAANPFLEKALTQITVPLFAFVMIQLSLRKTLDFPPNAAEHARIVEAILAGNRRRAVQVTQEVIRGFQAHSLEVVQQRG
jgi:DNA-binding GntR family transcriptional regulator